jgi:hypothetical protein
LFRFFQVPFPICKIKNYTLIVGFKKGAKFAPDRVTRGLGMSPLFLSIESGGLCQLIVNEGNLPWAPRDKMKANNDL